MERKQKTIFGSLFLGIPLDPTLGVGDKVLDHVDESVEAAKRRDAVSEYWTACPKCGRRVVREELREKGCFICGYKPDI